MYGLRVVPFAYGCLQFGNPPVEFLLETGAAVKLLAALAEDVRQLAEYFRQLAEVGVDASDGLFQFVHGNSADMLTES